MRHSAIRISLAVALAVFAYRLLYRPLQLRWGATQEEVTRAVPGDKVQPKPVLSATPGITIRAQPEEIWPWLMQMGYLRGGCYGYDRIDNDGIPSAMQLLPEWPQLQVNDAVPLWRDLDFPVVALQPNQ